MSRGPDVSPFPSGGVPGAAGLRAGPSRDERGVAGDDMCGVRGALSSDFPLHAFVRAWQPCAPRGPRPPASASCALAAVWPGFAWQGSSARSRPASGASPPPWSDAPQFLPKRSFSPTPASLAKAAPTSSGPGSYWSRASGFRGDTAPTHILLLSPLPATSAITLPITSEYFKLLLATPSLPF